MFLGTDKYFSYIETGGEGAIVRPWFWISWLFFGPVLCSLLFNRYNYIAVRGNYPIPCDTS